jgi:putative transposase
MGLRNRILLSEERCFFVTTTCHNHQHFLIDETCFQIVLDSFKFYNNKYNARLLAYVLLNNHIHFVIYFESDNRLSDYMRDFKKFTSLQIRQHLLVNYAELATRLVFEHKGQFFKIWDVRFDDVYINTKEVCETKIAYIHANPVRAGLAEDPVKYRFSSAAFYLTENKQSALLDYRDVF